MKSVLLLTVLAAGRGPALSAEEVFARASHGVGVILAEDRLGSAVVVSKNRVVTNWHVVEGAARASRVALPVVKVGKTEEPAVLVAVDKEADLAVLQILHSGFDNIPRRRTELPAIGEKAYTIGSPKGFANSLADGLVSNIQKLNAFTLIQTTAAISPGSSGGGLFDSQARLVGITVLSMKDG